MEHSRTPELRRVVRIMIRLLPASARYLQQQVPSRIVYDGDLARYLCATLGPGAPMPVLESLRWQAYLAEALSWASGRVVTEADVSSCIWHEGHAWHVSHDDLALLGLDVRSWRVPLDPGAIRAAAPPVASPL